MTHSEIPSCPLPISKRFVTSHDAEGKAKVWIEDEVERRTPGKYTDDVTFGLVWTTDQSPADIQTEFDGKDLPIGELTSDHGSVVRYVDFPPLHKSPMHRTTSIDYGFVLFGSVELILSDGTTTLIEQGNTVVQRGTDHAWRNPSTTEWARMVYVLLPGKPIVIDGVVLGDKSIH